MSNHKLSMEELSRISPEEFKSTDKAPLIVVLDNVRSGLNVGSVFRSGDAFLIERIVCCGFTPTPPHREVLKTALGATDTVAWSTSDTTLETIQNLKQAGFRIAAIEQTSNSIELHDFTWKTGEKWAIVFGNEVSGVDQAAIDECDTTIEIAQRGSKHSLNVSVAAGIVIHHLTHEYFAKK
jgi:23S rRNA (guanosine2251-2'-O)-methyltransferase